MAAPAGGTEEGLGGPTRFPRMWPSQWLPVGWAGWLGSAGPSWLLLPVPWVSLFRGFKETHLLERRRKTCKHGNGLKSSFGSSCFERLIGYLMSKNGVGTKVCMLTIQPSFKMQGGQGLGGACGFSLTALWLGSQGLLSLLQSQLLPWV